MVFSALLGFVSRTSGGSWRATVVAQGFPFSAADRGLSRTFTTAGWATHRACSRERSTLLPWCQRDATPVARYHANTRPGTSSAGHLSRCVSRKGMSTGSNPVMATAAAGEPSGGVVKFVTTEAAARRNADPGSVAFVTGANRGIGLEVTRQLLQRAKGTVVAACRDPSSAADLHALGRIAGNEKRLDVVKMDIEDQASLETAAEHVRSTYGRVDLLFNVAGVLGDGKNTPGPERSVRVMDRDWLRHTLEVNTIGPMMLVAALTPLLESPAKKGDAGARPPSVVVNFSARVGSIGDNGLGGWHSYRMSKSALNMATKGISIELRRRRVWAFSYHPGTTDTGLSEPFQGNVKPEKLFTPDYTVSQVLGIVDSMTEDLSGGFYAFDGSRIVW
ncbi:unnamed protein product [Ectocarpus sp. 4 AP-2014]